MTPGYDEADLDNWDTYDQRIERADAERKYRRYVVTDTGSGATVAIVGTEEEAEEMVTNHPEATWAWTWELV